MKDAKRYRILGGLCLGAVAAIAVPMFFDAPRSQSLPAVSSDEIAAAVRALSADDAFAAEADALLSQDNGKVATDFDEIVTSVKAIADTVDAEGFLLDSGTRFGHPILNPPTRDSEVFAVQVGEFDSFEAAKVLRSDVREGGYEAFISSFKKNRLGRQELSYRVAIGPLLGREHADAMRQTLVESFNTDALVMEMTH